MDSLKTMEFGCDRQLYSDAGLFARSVRYLVAEQFGQFVPATAALRLKSDQRTQMSDAMAARQPFQPVGHACDSSVLHAASTTRSETALTARSGGSTGLRLK
jgi:hypothetical protein